MRDELSSIIGIADPLRCIDPRYEPCDPLFDSDEPQPGFPLPRRKRKAVAAAIVAGTIACGAPAGLRLRATDSILVQLAPDAPPPARKGTADSGPPIVSLPLVSSADAPLLRVPLQPGEDPEAMAEEAARQPGVEFAEPVYLYQPARTPDDPRFKELWGLAKVDAPAAWDQTVGSEQVTVAVIDDGIALDHPDLAANLWTNPGEIAGNRVDDDFDGIEDDVHGASFIAGTTGGDPSPDGSDHGTRVAGIIGAAGGNQVGITGVNWKVSLMGLRALSAEGGRSDDLARAIDYAVDHGARVINASWTGGGESRALAAAIGRAEERGVLFVAAAGNDAADTPGFPASLGADNVISVGATTPDDLLAGFSNRGALVAAPGVGILSTAAGGRYQRGDGTSMASPFVAGLSALLWSAAPAASLSQVRRAILDSATPIEGVERGRVDAARALEELRSQARAPRGALELSRPALSFSARSGRIPRAQTLSLQVAGGGARKWWAQASNEWIVLPATSGTTPARVAVRVDPGGLTGAAGQGSVVFVDDSGMSVTLAVSFSAGSGISVHGEGCSFGAGGAIHARANAGCELRAAEGEANAVQWRLPGGEQINGARLFGHFVRKGQYQVLVSRDEGAVDPLAVVIE